MLKNLEVELTDTVFWTDSFSVLSMSNNASKKFPVFVANRLSKIEGASDPKQWRYVESKLNPADDASGGYGILKRMASFSCKFSGVTE